MNENKTNINWLITIQSISLLNPYNIRKNSKTDLAYFYEKYAKMAGIKRLFKDIDEKKFSINDLDKESFCKYMYKDLPPIDLMIRTSGEIRTSNFLPWQIAYAEYVFTPVYFPDFKRKEFVDCLIEFNKRNRRYGGLENEKEDN